MCSSLLVLKWEIWSVIWKVILQELLSSCLDLQERAYLDSWALQASPRGTFRLSEIFPPLRCGTPLFIAWLMWWRWVFSPSFDDCASLWGLGWGKTPKTCGKGVWQETGSVLGKQSWHWGIRDHGCAILGHHCSWELDGFFSLGGRNGCFLSASADLAIDAVAGVVLTFSWRAWLVSLIGTVAKRHSPWLLKEKVSAQAVELRGLGNGALQLYPCQLASFPLLLFSSVLQMHKARQPVCCPIASNDWHVHLKWYT